MKREILHNGQENGFETFVEFNKDLVYFVKMVNEWVGGDVYEKVATEMIKCIDYNTEKEVTLSEEEIKETLKWIRL